MKFKTSITKIENNEEIIRGHKLSELIKEASFSDAIFLILKGEMPKENESKMFASILTAVIDHGPGVASAMNARISASAKNPLHVSVAAGLLGLGDRHGVVVSQAMEFYNKNKEIEDLEGLLKTMKENKEKIMGYGHKMFTDEDPRASLLFELAKENNIYSEHCKFAEKVSETLNNISSKKLPLNADGAIAAILCDMGFDPMVGNGIFVIARTPGLVAHVVEEVNSGEGIRRADNQDIEYTD